MDYGLFGTIKEKFTDHLIQEGNERVLYSGKFGEGKFTFPALFKKFALEKYS